MKLLFVILTAVCLSMDAWGKTALTAQDTIGWEMADSAMNAQDYKAASKAYAAVGDNLLNVYKDINHKQVEDLRRVYSIDTVQLERNLAQQKYQQLTLLSIFVLISIVFLLAISIYWQNKKLIKSKEELNRTKEQIEQSIQNKSIFLSNMSHEIRTPLNALIGFSDLLSTQEIDEETRLECSALITQNSELLLRLIDDVIDLSCQDVTHMQFNLKSCNAVELANNVVRTLSKIRKTKVHIHFETKLEELYLYTDIERLQQVIINLITNALKFTFEGKIMLELKKEDEHKALFIVTDTGCGIPIEKQGNLFTRFKKVDENKQGTGLGLSICKVIVENLGGTIQIDSTYREGARFVFSHPIK
ncbi:MAG: sensor histidine kinase [Phocaeicola sp.]